MRLLREHRWRLLADITERTRPDEVPATTRSAITEGLARDVAERIERHDTEGVSAEIDACTRIAIALTDDAIRSRCREFRIDVLRRHASTAMLRVRGAMGNPAVRRLASWIRWRAQELGWTSGRLERELSEGPTGPALHALLAVYRRPRGGPEFARLDALFGPRPRELAEALAQPSRHPPWAALRQARIEAAVARQSVEEILRIDPEAADGLDESLDRLEESIRIAGERLRRVRLRAFERVEPTPENAALRQELGVPLRNSERPRPLEQRIAFLSLPVGPAESLQMITLLASWNPIGVGAWHLEDEAGHELPWTFATTRESDAGGPHLTFVHWVLPHRGHFKLRAVLTDGVTLESTTGVTRSHRDHRAMTSRRSWTPAMEALYSAWIRHLTDVPEGTRWASLHLLLGDRSRNLLHGVRGLGEDDASQRHHFEIRPDCADLSPALRLYFSWKLRLPMAIPRCERVSEGLNHCEDPPEMLHADAGAARAQSFIHASIQSLTTDLIREDFWSDRSLLYPVPLTRDALRPGTVYVDPFGHILTLARWLPENADGSRILLAIDSQPGGIVTLKRYWPGYFVFAPSGMHAGAGFRAFRPVLRRQGWAMFPTNAELELEAPGAPLSYEQASMTGAEFRDRMDALLSSRPRDPRAVFDENLGILHQMLRARAQSTDQAEQWYADRRGEVIPMPAGSGVFATTGPWEELATICRDLRLAVALRLVNDLRDSFHRSPSRYAFASSPTETIQDLDRHIADATAGLEISFRGSSGATHSRSVAEILADSDFLELGYNPNDCAEVRWGLGAANCRHRASEAQQRQMREYVRWFRNGYGCD